jgi:hypothetical protein
MDQSQNSFELNFKDGKIRVQRHTIGGHQTVYRVAFSDARPPLVLTRAAGKEIGMHWTSIPEGRFNEAEEVGPLIEQYYKQ